MIVPDWAGYLHWRDRFAEGMDKRFYPIDYLDGLILCGHAFLWIGRDAAIVAEVKQYPGGAKVIAGLVAAGSMDEIVNELIPQAEIWGLNHGCTHAMIESREGWSRALKPMGYRPFQTAVVKPL